VSSQDGGRPGNPPRSDDPAEGPEILEQGSDRSPARWQPAVRWRRPPRVAIILGVAGLLVGLAAGYAGGTLRAGKATAPPAPSGATVPPEPLVFGGAQSRLHGLSQFQLRCSAPAGATASLPLGTPVTNVSLALTAPGKVIVRFPSAGLKLTCRQLATGP
jgi:hypothetical protein